MFSDTFAMVNSSFTYSSANLYHMRPRYRCLEDYASYYTHMVGGNGQQDFSLPLVGDWFDKTIPGGFKSTPSIYCCDSKCA